ncbi:MAG: kinase [Novosphingobium sp.]|nr:kinase [Novosphingobium sp.]
MLVVGLCGPQGSGKSTGAAVLRHLLAARALRTEILSLDDLYLTRTERARLANSVHPLLATRGPPGTHDVQLGIETLQSLSAEKEALIPRFDKAADDRAPVDSWARITGRTDIVIFEGWCVGARPEPDAALREPINELERVEDAEGIWRGYVNDALKGTYQQLFGFVNYLVLIEAPDFSAVVEWRREQEHKLRARAGSNSPDTIGIMSDTKLHRFMQLYERTTANIAREMPSRADMVIPLDRYRNIVTTGILNRSIDNNSSA